LKKTDTMQVEIVRGSDALRFGLDADGGVMRIKRAKPASAAAADAQKRPSDVGDGSNNGMSDNTGFGTGGGTRMGGGMGGIGGMGGMNRSSMSGASNAQIPIGIATKNSIYPIVFIGSRRVTDDSLYKYKPDMLAFVEIMDSTAAVAAYGDKGAGGAVIFTPIKVPEPAKKKKK
jgi:hypothetical protein